LGSNQWRSNGLLLGAQLRAIAIAGFADPKGPTGEGNARPSSRHSVLGHPAALTHGKCMHLPSGQWTAELLFSKSFFQQIRLHAQVRIHSIQTSVLIFHGLHLADQGRIHAAIFRPPFVKRGIAHAMFTAQLGHRHTAFGLPQDRDDLFIGAYAAPPRATVPSSSVYLLVFIQNPLTHLAEKSLLMQPPTFGGDYHMARINVFYRK
jgi:hypothetical protein